MCTLIWLQSISVVFSIGDSSDEVSDVWLCGSGEDSKSVCSNLLVSSNRLFILGLSWLNKFFVLCCGVSAVKSSFVWISSAKVYLTAVSKSESSKLLAPWIKLVKILIPELSCSLSVLTGSNRDVIPGLCSPALSSLIKLTLLIGELDGMVLCEPGASLPGLTLFHHPLILSLRFHEELGCKSLLELSGYFQVCVEKS
nr:hypothetical protein [Lactarius zonarius]